MPDSSPLQQYSPFLIAGAFFVIMAIVGLLNSRQQGKRREELAMFAVSAGLQWTDPATMGMANYQGGGGFLSSFFNASSMLEDSFLSRFQGFQPFGDGYDFMVNNLMIGTKNNIDWYLFDYRFTTGSGKSRETHRYSIFAARVPYTFPMLSLKPETVLTRMGEHLGLHELKFELDEFNRRYFITCNDDKVAYDILCPQIIDYMMKQPARYWQMFGMYVMVVEPTQLQANACYEVMQEITDLVSMLPNYVRQDLGFQPRWTNAFD
jgi:hypothetical protein